jgi:hypothetical protein
MLKKLGGLLDFLLKLKQAWPVILVVVSIILAVFLGLAGIGKRGEQVNLYLPAVVVIMALALYPIAKLVEWFVKRKKAPVFEYAGFLWRPSIFRFRYPTPLCPVKGCGCEVTYKEFRPQFIGIMSLPTGHELDSQFSYTCPIHGTISQRKNEDMGFLKENAQIIQNKMSY